MKKCAAFVAGLVMSAAVVSAAMTRAAPAPPPSAPPPERWEYGELMYIPAGRSVRVVAPAPGGPAPPLVAGPRATWAAGEEEVEAGTWEELAAKLKAPEGRKAESPAAPKLRVLNHLGRQGWELVAVTQPLTASATTVSTFVFKRKVR